MTTDDLMPDVRLRLMCLDKAIQVTGAGPTLPHKAGTEQQVTVVAETFFTFVTKAREV